MITAKRGICGQKKVEYKCGVFTPPNPEVMKALQKQWDERDRKAAKAKKEELK